MKYPLTEAAKMGARQLVKTWDEGHGEQYMVITSRQGNIDIVQLSQERILEKFGYPLAGVLFELKKFGLIDLNTQYDADGRSVRIEILLLQELRNAVATDFDVSDYFVTMNAVGNIIVNSTTGAVQGVGVNTGTLHQTVEQIADNVSATLGQDFLDANAGLKVAIDELRTAVGDAQKTKSVNLIMQLANSLQHGANTATVITALNAAAPFVQRLLGG